MSTAASSIRPPIVSFACLALGCYLAIGFGYLLWQSDWPPFWPPMDVVLHPLDVWVDDMPLNHGMGVIIAVGAAVVLLTPVLLIIGIVGCVRWASRRQRAQTELT